MLRRLAAALSLTGLLALAALPSAQVSRAAGTGSLAGTVLDAQTSKPIAHTFVIVNWTTLKRVAETDAAGHFRVDGLPTTTLVGAFGFAQGYLYYHGGPVLLKPGKVTDYSFKMPRQNFPAALLPTLTGAALMPGHVKAGQTVTFQAHVKSGQGGKLSAEIFAANGPLGHSVLLLHAGGDLYRGTYQIPAGTASGTYTFSYFAAMQSCFENLTYGHATVTVGS